MCGFVTVYHPDPGYVFDANLLNSMRQSIARRGPDESGTHIIPNVAMAHQRLSIVDINAGKQPMTSSDGVECLVYNGEIYNYREIRLELESLGVQFYSDSDTEVLLKACSFWGPESAVKRFNGMFAFVLWDSQKRRLFAARDRFGIKPLFFAKGRGGETVFASDIKAIDIYFERKQSINKRAMDAYLTLGYVHGDMTFFEGVYQLLPGETIQFTPSVYGHKKIFWDPQEAMSAEQGTLSQADGISLLGNAVARQSMGEVPIGGFLSGGLDSTLLASIYMKHHSGTFRTYSAGFDFRQNDEAAIALETAYGLGATPTAIEFDKRLLKQQGLLLDAYTTPFADNAALPMIHLSQNAKEHIDVVLSGDGADELFFGYRNHKLLRFEQAVGRISPSIFSLISSSLKNHASGSGVLGKISRFSSSVTCPLARAYVIAMSMTPRGVLDGLYSGSMRSELTGWRTEHDFEKMASDFNLDSTMKLVQYLDMKTYLPGSVLTKVDRATMAHGLEARVPYLDNDLVNAALSQPHQLNMGWGENKKQLRQWSRSFVDREMMNRKKKSFTSPLDQWFREESFRDVYSMVASEGLMDSGLFSEKAILDLINNHRNNKQNSGVTLWSLSVLAHFLTSR